MILALVGREENGTVFPKVARRIAQEKLQPLLAVTRNGANLRIHIIAGGLGVRSDGSVHARAMSAPISKPMPDIAATVEVSP